MILPIQSPTKTSRLNCCVYVCVMFALCSETTISVTLGTATMATTESDTVCYLWDSMTSIEQASFVHSVLGIGEGKIEYRETSFDIDDVDVVVECVVDDIERDEKEKNKKNRPKPWNNLLADANYPQYIPKLYSNNDVTGAAYIESAKRRIADALNDDDDAEQNMLVKLVNSNEETLAMKLLTNMADKEEWRSFIERSLDTVCVGVQTKEDADKNEDEDEDKVKDKVEDGRGTLLHEAAKYGCIDDLRDFITTDMLSNLPPNDIGDTPLHLAAAYGHIKDLEVLLETSSPENVFTQNNNGWTPLHYAVSNKRPCREIISKLIDHALEDDQLRSTLDAQTYEYKNTAFHLACLNEHADETIMKLFERADPMICNADQRTPLHLAAEREHDPQPIAVLLEIFLPRMSKSTLTVKGGKDCNYKHIQRRTSVTFEPHCQTVPMKRQMSSPTVRNNNNRQPQGTVFFGGKSHIDTLLHLCAKNGHRDAVALLLQYGADPKYVLHVIVEESAKRKDKIYELLAVYEAVVENVVVPDCRWLTEDKKIDKERDKDDSRWLMEDEEMDKKKDKENDKETIWKPVLNKYFGRKRNKIINLVEKQNNSKKNVIERAIELGAKDLLEAILNTPNVFRFDDVGEVSKDLGHITCPRTHYDVTNMIPSTMPNRKKNSFCKNRVNPANQPAISYIALITAHESVWRQHDILRMEPFKKLSKSYVGFMKRVDLLIGIIHLIYITFLSVNFLPTKCSLNEQFLLNMNECNATTGEDLARDPAWGWVIWPVILLAYQLYAFISYVINVCSTVMNLNINRQHFAEARNISNETEAVLVKILLKLIDKVLFYMFSIMAIFWFVLTPDSHTGYLQVVAIVFLCGWLITFLLFCRITKGTYVLSIVLKSVLIHDLLFTFVPIFVVSVIAFTCALYVLQMTVLNRALLDFEATFYEIFATAFTMGNLYEYTIDDEYKDAGGNRGFLKAVYVAYLSLTALVLFNYLIAMLTARYDKEAPDAENGWRFDILIDAMHMKRHRSASYLFSWIHKVNYWFIFFCTPQCNNVKKVEGRHFITVQRWRPWQKESSENKLAKSSFKAVDEN